MVSLSQEGVDDDGDEQVNEYLEDQNVEQDEESNGDGRVTALERLSTIRHHALIRLIFAALVVGRVAPRQVKHDDVPRFTR